MPRRRLLTVLGAVVVIAVVVVGLAQSGGSTKAPEAGRFELRIADGAVNPYLLQAGILAAGLDGIRNRRDPGKRLDIDMYVEGHTVKEAKRLPLNLIDALRAFEGSATLKQAFGDEFCTAYVKLKTAEWNAYAAHLTEWERDNTLDC